MTRTLLNFLLDTLLLAESQFQIDPLPQERLGRPVRSHRIFLFASEKRSTVLLNELAVEDAEPITSNRSMATFTMSSWIANS